MVFKKNENSFLINNISLLTYSFNKYKANKIISHNNYKNGIIII